MNSLLDSGLIPGCVTFLIAALVIDRWVRSMIRQNLDLKRVVPYLVLSGVIFSVMALSRIVQVDATQSWSDGGTHHIAAVQKMYQIQHHGIFDAIKEIRPGNPFFQLLTGLLYLIIGPFPEVLYVVFGGLGFMAMAYILDVLIRAFPRAPAYLAATVVLLPSAWFWTPINLKEGPMLWCIAVLLRSASFTKGSKRPLFEMAVAAFMGVLLRPHIFLGWIAGVGFTTLFRRFNLGAALVSVSACFLGLNLMAVLLPNLVGDWQGSLNDIGETSVRNAVSHGGSAISGAPIPFLTGALLILLRPYPWEVFDLRSLASGLEIWGLTGLGVFGWVRCRERRKLLVHPVVMTCLVALICLCLPFSYFYNMGLLVRQRLQVYPSILVLCIFPNAVNALRFARSTAVRNVLAPRKL